MSSYNFPQIMILLEAIFHILFSLFDEKTMLKSNFPSVLYMIFCSDCFSCYAKVLSYNQNTEI
jgi:hypothetical protein